MRISIIEDESKQIELLSSYLKKSLNENNIPYEITAYKDAESFLNDYKKGISIIFMDIELSGKMNGMDCARVIREKDSDVLIIFVTNMAQFAVQGYEVDATDFIVKPINYFSFKMKLEKALRILAKRNPTKSILFTIGNQKVSLSSRDILYVEVVNHDLFVHTIDNEYHLKASMKKAMDDLEGLPFSRCHIAYLVNLAHVKSATKNEVILTNDETLLMTRTRRKEFLADLSNYLSGGTN